MANKITKIINGVRRWLFALVGKIEQKKVEKTPQADIQQESQKPEIPQEDSVASDIRMFKDFVKRGTDKAKVLLNPFAKRGSESVTSTTKAVTGSVDNKFIKIIVRSFIIIFFAIILIFIASYLFRRLKEENGGVVRNGNVTPTPVSFDPYKPSVYAQDPEVLILEEDTNILEGELTGVSIKEGGINPPNLDYEISF